VLFDLTKEVNEYLITQENPDRSFLEKVEQLYQELGGLHGWIAS